jgi:hypothetical protein
VNDRMTGSHATLPDYQMPTACQEVGSDAPADVGRAP